VLQVYGTGAVGRTDGANASFNHPQGLALSGNTLYVADTQNHLVRAIDLQTHAVRTIAGTGERGRDPHGPALQAALASPWDLLVLGHTLYIANAGSHQLLALDLQKNVLRVAAGSGREDHRDGHGEDAALAQPSGLASDGTAIYIADSEVSSVRRFDPATGEVTTLVGKGLFDFGDVDGSGDTVRLQHPLGVAWDSGALFVADTYNHKIKRLQGPQDKTATSFVGTGKAGNGRDQFFEPGGLSASGGKIYVADTNNSRIVVVDEKTRSAIVLTLRFP
jgi:DNA-binding beta-propeller fold protein YncE